MKFKTDVTLTLEGDFAYIDDAESAFAMAIQKLLYNHAGEVKIANSVAYSTVPSGPFIETGWEKRRPNPAAPIHVRNHHARHNRKVA